MDNIVNIRVLLEHLIQLLLIGDVQRVVLGPLAADELDTVHDFWGGVVEVVDDDDLVVGFEEGKGCERANVAGTTKPLSVSIGHDAVLKLLGGVEG